MAYLLVQWLVASASILVAAFLVPGLRVDGWFPAIIGAAVLGTLNVLVKPLLILLTLPLTVLTLGLFLLVVNAIVLSLVGYLVPGFRVSGFWAAFFGALVISVVTSIADGMLSRAYHKEPAVPEQWL